MLGISLSLTAEANRRAAPAWSPLSLFADGAQGAWYDPSDLSTLFQDVAGTVPVTTDGDPVALMRDKSGNGNHAVQSAAPARPTWRTDGTLSWIEYDGADDHLIIPAIGYSAHLSVVIGLHRYPSTAWSGFRSASVIPPYVNAGASQQASASTATNTAGGTDRLGGAAFSGTRIDLYNALLTPAVGSALNITNGTILEEEGTFFCYAQLRTPGRVFGFVEVGRAFTGEDIAPVESWMAAKTGMTL